MSHSKTILISVFLSTAISTLITLALVLPLKNTDLPEPAAESPITNQTEVTTSEIIEVVPEAVKSPLELEFDNLVKRNQEIAVEMEKFEFTDPKHVALLQELNELGKKIEENIIERKRNQVVP